MTGDCSPLRVLVVDDEPLVCWSLAQALGDCGDLVTEAADAGEAVRALETARDGVDVVLLDFRLPDSNDLELFSTVRRLAPRSRVILMSASLPSEVARDALALGAAGVLAKPFDLRDVAALVHQAPASSAA